MKAISLWQPWASLIACGAKRYETRSWAPPRDFIGQTIAIHAAKKIDKEAAEFAEELVYDSNGEIAEAIEKTVDGVPDRLLGKFRQAVLPIGCVLCTARLDAAFLLGDFAENAGRPAKRAVRRLVSRQMPECFSVRVDEYGDYAEGRWAWLLTDVKLLMPPPPVVGRQGFFDLPPGWLS